MQRLSPLCRGLREASPRSTLRVKGARPRQSADRRSQPLWNAEGGLMILLVCKPLSKGGMKWMHLDAHSL